MALSLSNHPPLPAAMDYAFLRQQGIEHIQRMGITQWTDFNAHDPGITLLEQLCYALTDLAYRIDYSLPDLLYHPEAKTEQDLYRAETILPSCPLTINDWRKVLLDIQGVQNAWIEILPPNAQPPLAYRPTQQTLSFYQQTDTNTTLSSLTKAQSFSEKVSLTGLYRVLIETSDSDTIDGSQVLVAVKQCLQRQRNVGEDFADISILPVQKIPLQADIEIEAVDNAEALLATIYQTIAEVLSPPIKRYSVADYLQKAQSVDALFAGPLLQHGFIDEQALQQQRPRALYSSDLIQALMAIKGVRAVTSIALGTQAEAWSLLFDPQQSPRFDPHHSKIRLKRQQLPVQVDLTQVFTLYQQARLAAQPTQHSTSLSNSHPLRTGRDRQIQQYYSFQQQLPSNYGLGDKGLPASASPQRQAQAKQLKAYLLFFDQLLANYFAQLAHLPDVFSFGSSSSQPQSESGTTTQQQYFTQALNDPSFDLATLLPTAEQAHYWQHENNDNDTIDANTRQQRFLNHLLARFAEQFSDYSLLLFGNNHEIEQQTVAKQAFLQQYPRLSQQRGTGINYSHSDYHASGLEQRLRYKLGMSADESCMVVEHILLRPLPSDAQQQQPLLSELTDADPYSLSVTVVLADKATRFDSDEAFLRYQYFVAKTLDEELPAHLTFELKWLTTDALKTFHTLYQQWRQQQYHYAKQSSSLTSAKAVAQQRRLRATRDALIDVLAFAQTYPLQDIPLQYNQQVVAFGKQAKIILVESQAQVRYSLLDKQKQPVYHTDDTGNQHAISVIGNGEQSILETPPIAVDGHYFIQAEKQQTGKSALLHQAFTVKVGLDVSLLAVIDQADLLVAQAAPVPDHAARLINYADTVQVIVKDSQEGVDYQLVVLDTEEQQTIVSQQAVRGNLSDIVLTSIAFYDDTDLRILASKTFDTRENRPAEHALLTSILPLKVRANPALEIRLTPKSAIIPLAETLKLSLKQTQANVAYGVYLHALTDNEFRYGHADPATESRLAIAVNKSFTAQIAHPKHSLLWQPTNDYQAVGTLQNGTGNRRLLHFELDQLVEDSVILIQAQKQHTDTDGTTVISKVMLTTASAVLVEPNAEQALQLQLPTLEQDGKTATKISIKNGQLGVLYRLDYDGKTMGEVYFHQHDNTLNKGLNQLRIGIDFVLRSDHLINNEQTIPLAKHYPDHAELQLDGIIDSDKLTITAIKARSQVATLLTQWGMS